MKFFKFLGSTFCDARGVPDGGRITQFVCIALVVAMVLKGLVFSKYGPFSYFSALLVVAVTGAVTNLFENKAKIEAEAAIAIKQVQVAAGTPDPPLVGSADSVTLTTNSPAS